ncbi:protein croquemort-like [Trichogramma pretiosum]|uniref:protein croquemort-like n=1 Tax=Trichogramma pretiosum TaxID=7493 RepID=UPI0006C9D65F|nr:protein croquemort-like [Trichogramma pretiosum]
MQAADSPAAADKPRFFQAAVADETQPRERVDPDKPYFYLTPLEDKNENTNEDEREKSRSSGSDQLDSDKSESLDSYSSPETLSVADDRAQDAKVNNSSSDASLEDRTNDDQLKVPSTNSVISPMAAHKREDSVQQSSRENKFDEAERSRNDNSDEPIPSGYDLSEQKAFPADSQDIKKPSIPSRKELNGDKKNFDDSRKMNDSRKPKNTKEMLKVKKKIMIMMPVALFALIFGITTGILWPTFFNDILQKELTLTNTSTSYDIWKETPVPMYLKMYMFNWTNFEETLKNASVKPHFDEVGPYVFREVDIKMNKTWNKNGTITFRVKRVWHFIPEESKGNLTDEITNLNPIVSTAAYLFRYYQPFIKFVFNQLFEKMENIVVTKTVQQLLFDGFDDKLLKIANALKRHNVNVEVPFDKFAWFYQRNNSETYDGIYNMNTGISDFYDMGMVREWKYKNTSASYPNCGHIRGSIGDLWPPLKNNKTLSVFSPDICTSLNLKAKGTSTWLDVTGSKYVSDEDTFDNGAKVDSMKCYCQGRDCQPSGTLNISSCKFGAPAFVSLPHFYLADKSYAEKISGMNPDEDKHEFQLVIHPDTGIPLQVRGTLQINFYLYSDDKIKIFDRFAGTFIPMIWFTQEVKITPEFAKKVKLLDLLPPVVSGVLWSIAGIGVLLILVSISIFIRQKRKDDEVRLLNNDSDKDPEVPVNDEA